MAEEEEENPHLKTKWSFQLNKKQWITYSENKNDSFTFLNTFFVKGSARFNDSIKQTKK